MGYLHGVETKEVTQGKTSIKVVATSIIGLVGIATKGKVNQVVMVSSIEDAEAEFGKDVNGTTIIPALKVLFDNGGAVCLVVNVGDATKMNACIDSATNKIKLVGGKYATQTYEKSMSTAVGYQDFTAAVVSGLDLLLNAESAYGIKPKLLLAPGYSGISTVKEKMLSVAGRLKAKALIDINADSVKECIQLRGTDYNTSNNRAMLCFPTVVRYNDNEATEQTIGMSVYTAAGMVVRDKEKGYWYSPSNQEMSGMLKTSIPIVSSLTDELADTSILNGAGILTIFRTYGTGFRLWGNWTAGFPSGSDLKNMIAASRVADIIDESIQKASLAFMDNPVNAALIEYVRGSVNSFLFTLKSKGAIVDGACIYDKSKNPAT